MLVSILGPDATKKIMAKLAALICVILAWLGLIMVMMNSFYGSFVALSGTVTVNRVLINHAILWPMLIGFFCAGAALVVGGKNTKVILSCILSLLSLWVMMSTTMGWLPVWPPIPPGLGFGEPALLWMTPVPVIGSALGVLGGIVGFMGAYKYMS